MLCHGFSAIRSHHFAIMYPVDGLDCGLGSSCCYPQNQLSLTTNLYRLLFYDGYRYWVVPYRQRFCRFKIETHNLNHNDPAEDGIFSTGTSLNTVSRHRNKYQQLHANLQESCTYRIPSLNKCRFQFRSQLWMYPPRSEATRAPWQAAVEVDG